MCQIEYVLETDQKKDNTSIYYSYFSHECIGKCSSNAGYY